MPETYQRQAVSLKVVFLDGIKAALGEEIGIVEIGDKIPLRRQIAV